MEKLALHQPPQRIVALFLLAAGVTAFLALTEWPGLNIDAALFTTPVVNLANGEGWKFHGYLYRLAKINDGSYNSHSLLYPLIFGIVLRANTYDKILFWSSVVNSLNFVGYFLAPYLLFGSRLSWLSLLRSLLLGITAGTIGVNLQGRPEQLVPLVLLVSVLLIRGTSSSRRYGMLIFAAILGATLALLGLLSPLTALVYLVGAMGWLAYSFNVREIRPPIWRMSAVGLVSAIVVVAVVFSFCSFSPYQWVINTFLYGSADPSSNWATRLGNFFGLNPSLDLPLWNIPVLLALIFLLSQLAAQSQRILLVLVGLIVVVLLKAAQSYVYVGFAPLILLFAFCGRMPAGTNPVVSRLAAWLTYGYTAVYSLVFVRTLLMLSLYLVNGMSYKQARAEIRSLTRSMSPQKQSIAYYWMRRPSFVVMDDQGESWITAEAAILDGKEQQLESYQRYSGKVVAYIVFPQLGHIERPPTQIRNGTTTYRLIHNGWTSQRASLLGVSLGGEVPGYNYALYELATS